MRFEFVEAIPEKLADNTLYVSIPFATAVHSCCCGCGSEVVTPLSPTDWKLTFDGETVSLYPSIGNWSLPCRSHYWITHGDVRWAAAWTADQIEAGRLADLHHKEGYYRETISGRQTGSQTDGDIKARPWPAPLAVIISWWARFTNRRAIAGKKATE